MIAKSGVHIYVLGLRACVIEMRRENQKDFANRSHAA